MQERNRRRSNHILFAILPMALAACTGLKTCSSKTESEPSPPQSDLPSEEGTRTAPVQLAPVNPLTPEEASAAIGARAKQAIEAWKQKDAVTLAAMTHPTKGVRFSPYSFVEVKSDIVFKKEDMANFFANDRTYIWGTSDGEGAPIQLAPRDYYAQFIYSVDFANAEKTSFNTILKRGNSIENMTEVYPSAAWVEYYFSGFNPEYSGMDWQSLRLLFEKANEEWYLVGVIHNQWTI